VGFNGENAEKIVIDIESCASPSAAQLLDPVRAPKHFKDPAKIDAYCRDEFEKRVTNAGLEADLCEIVAVGWQHADENCGHVFTRASSHERELLTALWQEIEQRAIIGFNVLGFDLPVLVRRSQILEVPYPRLNLDRYRTPHVDLLETLTFNGKLTYRTLGFYARLFGIPNHDQHKGADIAQLVAKEDWGAVANHCRSDVELTAALARRLGYLPQPVPLEQAASF
jgi:DNA polymerase elongation subunit (family B)